MLIVSVSANKRMDGVMTNGNDWCRHHLRGRVRYVHSEVVDLSDNAGRWLEQERRPVNTVAFNEHGYAVKELLYNLNGRVSQIGSTVFDVYGNRKELRFQNPQGGLLSSLRCEYDSAGKLLECVSIQAHGAISTQRCRPRYNQAGQKVEELWFDDDGMLSRKYLYKYNPLGQTAEQVMYRYDQSGLIDEKWTTFYDEEGNVVERLCFDQQGRTIGGPIRYKYNPDGDQIEASTFNLQGDLYSTSAYFYDLDAERNWIKRLEVFRARQSGFETRVVTYRMLEYYASVAP